MFLKQITYRKIIQETEEDKIKKSSDMDILNQKASILIVDDNPTNLKILFDIFQYSDFRVSVATSGENALEKIQEVLPDIILLDVMIVVA